MEDFTVYQGGSYGELRALRKENVLRASQYSHTAQSLHTVVRGFFFFFLNYGLFVGTFKLISHISIGQKIL